MTTITPTDTKQQETTKLITTTKTNDNKKVTECKDIPQQFMVIQDSNYNKFKGTIESIEIRLGGELTKIFTCLVNGKTLTFTNQDCNENPDLKAIIFSHNEALLKI